MAQQPEMTVEELLNDLEQQLECYGWATLDNKQASITIAHLKRLQELDKKKFVSGRQVLKHYGADKP